MVFERRCPDSMDLVRGRNFVCIVTRILSCAPFMMLAEVLWRVKFFSGNFAIFFEKGDRHGFFVFWKAEFAGRDAECDSAEALQHPDRGGLCELGPAVRAVPWEEAS